MQRSPEKIIIEGNGRRKVVTINDEPSITQQQFREQADINEIMKKYKKTGDWPQSVSRGAFMDTTNLPSYQEALDVVRAAESAFIELPAKVRRRFDNNPQELISFLEDPKNNQEAINLGLKEPNLNELQNLETQPLKTKTIPQTPKPE